MKIISCRTRKHIFPILTSLLVAASAAHTSEWTGFVGIEAWNFLQDSVYQQQENHDLSASVELEYFNLWDKGRHSVLFKPFFRVDQHDAKRTHGDIRELLWTISGEVFHSAFRDVVDVKVGIGKVFWGSTEFYHPNDIINQTDFVESPTLDSKLGQPMLNMALFRSWGLAELFILPSFRERTFPSKEGRFQVTAPLSTNNAQYQSGRGRNHTDWAVKWSNSFSGIDVSLSYFKGTGRAPRFMPNPVQLPSIEWIPFYEQVEQTGVYFQTDLDSWLWKFEAAYLESNQASSFTSTGGIEYTFVGLAGSSASIGLVLEYMHDERGDQAPHYYQNDIGVGLRVTLNDTNSTEALAAMVYDNDDTTQVLSIEISRRLGEQWQLNVDAMVFRKIPAGDVLTGLENDDYVRLALTRYF